MYSVRDFRSNFKLLWIFSQIFMKVPNVQFHGKPYSWSHADKSGRTERQADMAKLTGPFRDYKMAPKNKKDFQSVNEHSVLPL